MASVLKVDKLDPQSGTALEIGTSGDTVSIPSGATLDISASTLTPPATMPASSGINFTALNATNLGSGTVPTARLGTGTASSSTVLYGDQTYKAEPTSVFGSAAFSARVGSNTDISMGVETLCPLSSVVFDDDGNYDNTATNYKYTAPETGTYCFFYSVACVKSTGIAQNNVNFKKNGAGDLGYNAYGSLTFVSRTVDSTQIANAQTYSFTTGTFMYDLTAGDYLQLYSYFYSYSDTAIATLTNYGSRWGGWRVA